MTRKLGRFVFPAALVMAGYYAVFGGEYSVLEIRRVRGELREARSELDRLRTENDSLKAWADSLRNDPWTLEKMAREQHGLVGPGEEVIRTNGAEPRDTASGGGGG